MHTYDNYNFWQIKMDDLPSKGLFYPKDTIIKIRSLTVLEVKFLATLMPQTATGVCNELLEKCVILKNINFTDLLLPDRQFLIFWIRLNSFPLQNGFKITLPACLECGTPIEHEIKLEELVFTYLDDFIPFVHLDDENCDLIISIPKYNDSVIDTKDEIGDVAIYIDNGKSFEERYDFVANLSAYDFLKLKDTIKKNYCGIKTEIIVECPRCRKQYPVNFIINDQNLFNRVSLPEILETITRIAKYSNLQITNDWPWVEVIMEQDIINKLIKEENEANQKELNKAKSQMGSIPSMGGLPNIH